MLTLLTRLFPLWALLISIAACLLPKPFVAGQPMIVPMLGLIMFGMGMTLKGKDFAGVFRRPQIIALGTFLQFLVMPLAAWGISKALALPEDLMIGMVLVGCCPGGTASNVIAYLAKADVALSITLTTVSTLLSVLVTPWLVWLILNTHIEVDPLKMMWTITKIILLPVSVGMLLNRIGGNRLDRVKELCPLISVAAITCVIGIVVGLNAGRLNTVGLIAVSAVMLHNFIGLSLGYGLARLCKQSPRVARTIAIEVGMQNSGLGVVLAKTYFSTLAMLPGAIFSIWHNISGSILAMLWAQNKQAPSDQPT